MSFASSMIRKEQRRQMERRIANAEQHPKNLAGIVKEAAGLLGQRDIASNEYLCTFDCTCCNQRFVWDTREKLTACPLCGAGPKQKPSKMPRKRITHKQSRAFRRKATDPKVVQAMAALIADNGPQQQLKGQAADDERMRQQMQARDTEVETKEQEEARTEEARRNGTLIEATCTITTGFGGGGGDDVSSNEVSPEEIAGVAATDAAVSEAPELPPDSGEAA